MKTLLLPTRNILFRLLTGLAILTAYGQHMSAQCTLACTNVNIGLTAGAVCETTVQPSQVATDLVDGCTYTLTFDRTSTGGGPNDPPILTSADIGASIDYTLTSPDGACTGVINVFDGGAGPYVFCPDDPVDLPCGMSVLDIPAPPAVSCSGSVSVTSTNINEVQGPDCMATYYRILEVTYTYSDGSPSTSDCVVQYRFSISDPDDVVAPDDVTLECGPGLDLTTAALGVPTIDGMPFTATSTCNLAISDPVDSELSGCGNTQIITRTWFFNDICGGGGFSRVQTITIEDNTDPEISLPVAVINASTLPTDCISGDILLPAATVSDDCTAPGSLLVNMQVPVIGFLNQNGGLVSGLPVGTHTVVYTVIDACLNTATTSLDIVISDDIGPEAICRTNSVVALNNLGIANPAASSFDEGSTDNCNAVFFKARRMNPSACDPNPQFDDTVPFCCDDVGVDVMVILRVYEVNPGPGPVGEDDFIDASNECMVTVEVQDNIGPSVTCPGDVTVDCLFDLEFFETQEIPVPTDNCTSNLTITVEINTDGLNECGIGTAVRTITYSDHATNLVCIQNIEVENVGGGGPLTIIPPGNLMLTSCGAGGVHPDDLPDGFNYPQVSSDGCVNIAMRFEDHVFDIVQDACLKIVREWEVIDWCSFDLMTGEGRYTFYQLIKILDDESPEIVGLEDLTFSLNVNGDCDLSESFLNLPDITADDCTPPSHLQISYRIDFHNDGTYDTPFINGNNASGNYPIGEHRVQFRVDDRCGNISTGSMLVTLEINDLSPPTPVLKALYSVLMPGVQMVTLQASMFDNESYDNCTTNPNLVFSFSNDINDVSKVFDCDDVGTNPITIWVWDEAGNADFGTTNITIADNASECPGGIGGVITDITGVVHDEFNNKIERVSVLLEQSELDPVVTGEDGLFKFANVPGSKSYRIVPSKELNPRNGVSTLDMLHIQMHIMGLKSLDSPYKILAADVNNSGSVTGADLVMIQRLILGKIEGLGNQPSWKFIDAEYEFADPAQPFNEEVPFSVFIPVLEGPVQKTFIGLKMGDVNNSAVLSSAMQVDPRSSGEVLDLITDNKWVKPGEILHIPVRAKDFDGIMGMQGTISFRTQDLQFISLDKGHLPGWNDQNVNILRAAEGEIPFSWMDVEGATLLDDSPVFFLKFHVKRSGELKDLLSISSSFTESEFYSEKRLGSIKLNFTGKEIPGATNTLMQNKPNPFGAVTTVSFYLKEDTQGSLSIMDMTGRLVWQRNGLFQRGTTDIEIRNADLGAEGVYLYRLDTPDFSDTKRMVLVTN